MYSQILLFWNIVLNVVNFFTSNLTLKYLKEIVQKSPFLIVFTRHPLHPSLSKHLISIWPSLLLLQLRRHSAREVFVSEANLTQIAAHQSEALSNKPEGI
jgi:hypothetical protein